MSETASLAESGDGTSMPFSGGQAGDSIFTHLHDGAEVTNTFSTVYVLTQE